MLNYNLSKISFSDQPNQLSYHYKNTLTSLRIGSVVSSDINNFY